MHLVLPKYYGKKTKLVARHQFIRLDNNGIGIEIGFLGLKILSSTRFKNLKYQKKSR